MKEDLMNEDLENVSGGTEPTWADNGWGPHIHGIKDVKVFDKKLCGYWDYFQVQCNKCHEVYYIKWCGKDAVVISKEEYDDAGKRMTYPPGYER